MMMMMMMTVIGVMVMVVVTVVVLKDDGYIVSLSQTSSLTKLTTFPAVMLYSAYYLRHES